MTSNCQPGPAHFEPQIDRNRCECKGECVRVCPYHVYEIVIVSPALRKELSFVGRLKLLVHGGKQAFAVRADRCHACGLCVTACPEDAITLVERVG